MDKQTLSNYGWIVICTLVLAVMLAFASPFGYYIAGAIQSTTQGLFDVNNEALDAAHMEKLQNEWEMTFLDSPSNDTPLKFGQPYQMTMDGMMMEYVFYADGSATMWMADAYGGYIPAGSATYTATEVIIDGDPLSISADGTTLYDPDDETLKMTLNSVTTSAPKSGTYALDPNGFLGLGVAIEIEIGIDGSITMYQNGMPAGTISASSIVWYENYYTVDGEMRGAIYPDGSKITYGDYVCVARKPLGPGLYSATNQQLASWDELVNTYGMDVTKNYTNTDYQTNVNSPYYVLTNTEELSTGVRLIIDNNVTTIGDYAFRSCEKLTSIKLPDSLRSIGQYAFFGCSRLKNINIPEGITIINNHTFYQCTDLTSIEFPNSLTSIGRYAFFNCNSLTNISIPNGVNTIDDSAFSFCINLISITIPESTTNIGESVLYACSKLTTVTVDANNPKYCTLNDVLYTKDMKTLICHPAGKDTSTYSFPSSVTTIGRYAFGSCKYLTSIIIPSNITTIEREAFYSCDSFTSITLPNSLETIGYDAFVYCDSLTSITFNGTTEEWKAIKKGTNGTNWTYNIPATEVICSDGTVPVP